MKTVKKGNKSLDVLSLQCSLPGVTIDGDFGPKTEEAVKEYQRSHSLEVDGIVGQETWAAIISGRDKLTVEDFQKTADKLGVSAAILRAIHEVETSGKSYLSEGYPSLLFEAHIFWKSLKNLGIDPSSLQGKYPNIISKSWDKKLYKGGIGEISRVDQAWGISPKAALMSASWGSFQILGSNYGMCGCKDVFEFYKYVWLSERTQLDLLSNFLKSSGIVPYMKSLNFTKIAEKYNGPGQAKNGYSVKLEKAYQKYTHK